MGNRPITMSGQSLGPAVFDRLRAEYERSWLDAAFVEPDIYPAIVNDRSLVVFGEIGSGKTALALTLGRRAEEDPQGSIVVHWQPSMLQSKIDKDEILAASLRQILDKTANSVLAHIGRRPAAFREAPAWIQETVLWFCQHHILGNRHRVLGRLSETISQEGIACVRTVLASPSEDVLGANPSEQEVLQEIADVVQRMGWAGIWVVVDGLETWIHQDQEALTTTMDAMLSTLELLEIPGFALKIFAPYGLERVFMQTGGILRERLEVLELTWSTDELRKVAETRLAVACGREEFSLDCLCSTAEMAQWIEEYGGRVPRGWLELIRPLFDLYISQPQRQPLGRDECMAAKRLHPPRLFIDLNQERVFLGYKEITDITPTTYQILRYLYTAPQRLCTPEQLYYCAYKGLHKAPRNAQDEHWEVPASWRSWYDTTISRLRKAIEPNPKDPIYLVTVRGKGISLKHRK